MKKIVIALLILITPKILFSQHTLVNSIDSKILNEKRTIRIHLPKSYDKEKSFPLILTFDGEYMFYSLIGNTELLLATDKIPEVIVVGIDQNYEDSTNSYIRWHDCNYSSKTGEPIDKGVKFKKFITDELIPYLTERYKAGTYRTLSGHSLTATYSNFFLSDNSAFNSFILISPYVPKTIFEKIISSLSGNNNIVSYYMSTGEFDLRGHLKTVSILDSTINASTINKGIEYSFNNFDKETHYSLINRSLPYGLKTVFRDYQIITDKEVKSEKDLLAFLKEKYKRINNKYGINLSIRKDDLEALYWEAEEREDWRSLKEIGEFSIKIYPEYADGYFMLSEVEESNKNYSSALELYKKGFSKLGDDVLNKDDFYRDLKRLEKLAEGVK
jgi:predicted alpha/beta superfamily hydrolase